MQRPASSGPTDLKHCLETQVPNLANRDNLVNPAPDDWHGEGQARALREGETFFFRSAGACPPRSFDPNEKCPQPRGHGRLLLRPAHGEGQARALRAIFLP